MGFSTADLAKNTTNSQAESATDSFGKQTGQQEQDSSSGGQGGNASTGTAGGAAGANQANAGASLAGGAGVGSNPFAEGTPAGSNPQNEGISFGEAEVTFPVAEKAMVKYVEADFFPTDDYLLENNFPQGTSIVGESENKAIDEARITSSRLEPIAIFSQRTLDFSSDDLSAAYSAAYQAFIEDRISQAFSKIMFAKIKDSQQDFFENTDILTDLSIQKTQSVIDTMNSILLNIRKFENTFSNNFENIKGISSQLASEIAAPESMLLNFPIFDSLRALFVREYSASMGMSSAYAVFSKLTQTAQMAINLGIAQSYFQRGCSLSLLDINYPFQGGVNPFGVFLPVTKKQDNYPTDAPNYPNPDIRALSAKMLGQGTPLDGTDLEIGNYRYSANFDQFYRLEVRANRSRLDAALILSTIVANEFCTSAGLGRLVGTPLGSKFGPDSNFAKSLFGIPGAGDITKISTPPGSLADHLTVTTSGDRQTAIGTDNIVLLFDGAKHEKQTRSGVTTATTAFAKNVLRNSADNKMGGFKKAVSAAQNNSHTAMDFYVKVHNRDKDLDLLTPRGLFTRILEEVHTSLQEGGVGFDVMNTLKVSELSFYSVFGRNAPSSNKTHVERVRAIFYSALCRQSFTELQPDDILSGIDSSQSDAKVDKTKIRFARMDLVRAGIPYPKPTTSMFASKLVSVIPESTAIADGRELFSWNIEQLYKHIHDPGSLTARLANVFSDLHREAEEIAASEGGTAGIVGPDRYTRASKLDAASLSAMIFEIASVCVTTFFESKMCVTNMDIHNLHTQLFLTVVNSSRPNIVMENIEKNSGNSDITIGKGKIGIKTGPDSRNNFCARALQELINASKTNDFESIYNENRIPNLGNILSTTNIGAEGHDVVTFLQMQQKFEALAAERDVPFASLLAHTALVEHTVQNTKSLVNISDQISGLKERSTVVESYVDFISRQVGKKYVASATDSTIETSQKRLNLISKTKMSPIKRLPRIGIGELSCMKTVMNEIGNIGSDTVMLVNIGLPNQMLEEIIYPRFKTEAGFEASLSESTLKVSLTAYNALGASGKASIPVSRQFLPKEVITSDSFLHFENSPSPASIDQIVDQMILLDGRKGYLFILESADPDLARSILRNELFSYVAKKFASITSPADLFVETGKLNVEKDRVDSGASSLAQTFAIAAGLEESAFSGVFLPSANGSTKFSKKGLLTKTASPGKDNFGNVIPRKMDFATADMFADIFGSLAFTSSAIESSVFAESHYEKICCLVVSPDEFVNLEEESETIIAAGSDAKSADSYATFLQSGLSPDTVRMNTYEASISVGDRLILK